MENEPSKIILWSPFTVGFSALVLTYPVGALLAATNAHRLGDTAKKKKYLRFGVIYIALFLIFGYFAFDGGISNMGWIVNVVMAYTLFNEIKNEIEKKLVEWSITYEPWWKALLIAIAVLIAAGLFYLLFVVLMMTFNSQ